MDFYDFMLLTKQGGILKPFAMILGYLMEGIFFVLDKLHIPNTGLAIILFTIIIYLLLLPLTIKQQKFSKLSAKMNPELTAIRNKYNGKTDQESMQRMQQETQAVYQKYGVNPSGSCLQLLIQMPILFSLYRVIYNMPAYVGKIHTVYEPLVSKLMEKKDAAEFLQTFKVAAQFSKQFTNEAFVAGSTYQENTFIDVLNRASSAEWASLSEKFPDLASLVNQAQNTLHIYNNFLGLNIADSPSFIIKTEWAMDERNWFIIIGAILVPLLSALTQWINTKLMPMQNNNDDKKSEENTMMQSMKMMNTTMPLVSAFMCFSLPLGMGIYWIAGAVVRGIIMVAINKYLDNMDLEAMIAKNVDKANKKREKLGISSTQISNNATKSTKNVDKKPSKANSIKDTSDLYKNKENAKAGSLSSKAMMVKRFNENNDK